jgi:homoserine O-acetyltransferase
MDPAHPHWTERSPDVFRVRMETSKGSLVIEARREWAPRGCDRFYNLVRAGFFDDSRFFRVRRGVFVQLGIPGEPAVAAVWKDRAIPDDPVRASNTRGSVAYAMTGPDTRTTQLFVNLRDNPHLDAEGFAPIGTVVEGMEVVDQLYAGYAEEPGGGMRGGRQGQMLSGGNAYLDREFPLLDSLIRATVERVRLRLGYVGTDDEEAVAPSGLPLTLVASWILDMPRAGWNPYRLPAPPNATCEPADPLHPGEAHELTLVHYHGGPHGWAGCPGAVSVEVCGVMTRSATLDTL